jgi:hypothetical protein
LGHPVWHAPGELSIDSGIMSLGTSLLRGSHCGSNRTGDNIGGRYALPDDDDQDDNATDDALCSGHPVQHAPGELTRDSGSMLLGTSLLRGSHRGSNHNGNNGGHRRYAITDDALRSGHPVWHAPGELARDSGSMLLGTSLFRGSHHGSNCNGDNGSGGR